HALWGLDRFARSLRNIFPGIALVVGRRRARTCGPRAGGAVILAFQCDAETLVHGRLRRLRRGGGRRGEEGERGPGRTDDRRRRYDLFGIHGLDLCETTTVSGK